MSRYIWMAIYYVESMWNKFAKMFEDLQNIWSVDEVDGKDTSDLFG